MRTHNHRLFFLLQALLFLLIAPGALAQSGKIAGRVVDAATGEPVPGVNVVITEKWSNGRAIAAPDILGAATGGEGYYAILNVPPGTYNVTASFIGFAPLVKTEVRVSSGLTATVDFDMREEVIEGEEVEIVANRSVVQADISSTMEIISPTRMTQAPTQRLDEFIGKVKGVELVSNAQGSGLSIRGGDIRETDIRIDGQSVRDPRSGNSYLGFNTTTVEEIQVKTGGFEARYGGIQSGLVNIVTKEGSRDRFTSSFRLDYAPAGQRRFFGDGPWEPGSPLYETYSGMYAMTGVPDSVIHRVQNCGDPGQPECNPGGWIPDDLLFTGFRGWSNRRTPDTDLTAAEKLALWRAQHPVFEVASKPDVFAEGALTGPFFLPKTTFLLGVKYENTQFAFPLGPRDNYLDWNAQLKLTTRFSPKTKLSVNGMYAKIATINSGSNSTGGGAVVSLTDRFSFLSNSRSSVVQQAGMIGSDYGFQHLYNVGRTQFYDQRIVLGGAKLTHSLSPTTFFNLEGQVSFSDNLVRPFGFDTADPNNSLALGGKSFYDLRLGMPDWGVQFIDDPLGMFRLTGWTAASDSSYSWSASFKGDVTRQVGRHHQFEAGFDAKYNYLYVYSGINRSTKFGFEPGYYQYYTATPIEGALYIQDKLEYEGMVATIGLRGEYFNPRRHGYDISIPLDADFRDFWGNVYFNLPGETNSYERWVEWRDLLDEPPGWPKKDVGGKFKLSPRVGTSFPITTASKLYFNYGMFYQRPYLPFVYNQVIQAGQTTIPNPDLEPERTTAFEFGYEQSLFNNYLANVTFYYKDVQNRPLSVAYYSYYEDNIVRTYSNDAYRDIRGIELRLEKNFGKFFTFWANYDYQVSSSGQSGLAYVYENQLKANEQARFPIVSRPQPYPKAYVNLNFHTPNNFGPEFLGNYPLGGFYINPLIEWRDGGYLVWNPEETNPDEQLRVDVLDYRNVDLRLSKTFNVPMGRMEAVATIENVLNFRRLYTGNMRNAQLAAYKNSLKLPFKGGDMQGNDKWGEWDKDYLDIGWYTAPLYLNPRRVLIGLRLIL